MSNIEIIEDFILELKSFELNKDTLEIANALENILAEREQDKKRIQEFEEENRKITERYEEQENELYERIKQCKNMQTEIDRLYIDKKELEQAYLHEKIAKELIRELLEGEG